MESGPAPSLPGQALFFRTHIGWEAMCRHALIKKLFDIFIKRWVGYRNTIPVIKGGFPIGV